MGNQLCKCGCGKEVKLKTSRFCPGHWLKANIENVLLVRHPHSKGYKKVSKFIKKINYPFCKCGCKQHVKKFHSNYIRGHSTKIMKQCGFLPGNVPWNFGRKATPEERKHLHQLLINQLKITGGSKPEHRLRDALKAKNILFEANVNMFGFPDVVIGESKIAVFVDGIYWHARPDWIQKHNIKSVGGKSPKWIRWKDRWITKKLELDGWTVLRFWEDKINANVGNCVDIIEKTLEGSRGVDYEHTE